MKILTVFAHPSSGSFCHAVLDRFDAGLRDAGHENEIVDLYAIGFDPILRTRDNPSWLTETIPDDMLDRMRLRESLLSEAGGGAETSYRRPGCAGHHPASPRALSVEGRARATAEGRAG